MKSSFLLCISLTVLISTRNYSACFDRIACVSMDEKDTFDVPRYARVIQEELITAKNGNTHPIETSWRLINHRRKKYSDRLTPAQLLYSKRLLGAASMGIKEKKLGDPLFQYALTLLVKDCQRVEIKMLPAKKDNSSCCIVS